MTGPSSRVLVMGGGGLWNPKVQTFEYQKQPKSTFPFVKLHCFRL